MGLSIKELQDSKTKVRNSIEDLNGIQVPVYMEHTLSATLLGLRALQNVLKEEIKNQMRGRSLK